MNQNINNIHDKYFKELMSNREYAISFFKTFLPKDTLEYIDLFSLKLANKSYVSKNLEESFADILFEFKNKETSEKGYITLVIEHKSKPEKQVFLQISNYIIGTYLQQVKDNESLKTVIPMVFYHGKRRWEIKRLKELINNLPEKFKRFIPDFDVIFIDLGRFSDKQLLAIGNSWLSSALLTQKYSHSPAKLIEKAKMIFETLFSEREGNFTYSIFVYYMNLVNLREEKFQEIIESISQPIKKEVMSTYEMITKKYEQKGIEKEKKEIIIKGWRKGISIELLSDISGLPTKEVRSIIEQYSN